MVVKSINCLISDGTTCKIDLKFYKEFKKYNWYFSKNGYIVTRRIIDGKKQLLYLHHYVLNFKYDVNIDLVADHKYGNKRDCRLKKLRLVSHSINRLNQRGENSNTGFSNICCYCYKNHYYYAVSYLNIFQIPDREYFPYIEGENEEDVFMEAFEFFENIKRTLPHYIAAFPKLEEDSSSGESIEEINFDDKINIERLYTNNTSKLRNITDFVMDYYWLVNYYNKEGKRTTKSFLYFPRSNDTKDEALEKAIFFQKLYEEYQPKRKGENQKTIVIDEINIERLNTNNTIKLKNINDFVTDSYWLVTYYNKEGKRTTKRFTYFPKSNDTRDEALEKAIFFQKLYEKYQPKRKEPPKKTIVINNNTTINIININNNVVGEPKNKIKNPLLNSNIINIKDDDNTTRIYSNAKFLDGYETLNKKNIISTPKLDTMIQVNEYINKKSKFDLLLEENSNPKKSKFDILFEDDFQKPFEYGNDSISYENQ